MSSIDGHDYDVVKRNSVNLIFDTRLVDVVIVDYCLLQSLTLADCNRKIW